MRSGVTGGSHRPHAQKGRARTYTGKTAMPGTTHMISTELQTH